MKFKIIMAFLYMVIWPASAHCMETTPPAEPTAPEMTVAPSTSVESKPELIRKIEELFRLQDASARGSADSLQLQKTLLVSIGEKMVEQPLDSAAPLAFHAAAYVLSGGNPDVVDRLSHADGMSHGAKTVLEASTTFMRGDRHKAGELFARIDPAALPTFLAGRAALARAVVAEPNSVLQQQDLALAIASMPGTLVEESALRRSALAYAEVGNEDQFYQRITRYCRRFPNSIYADSFWSEVIRILVSKDMPQPNDSFSSFGAAISTADTARRKKIYLDLARTAAVAGKRVLMERASKELQALADPGSPEEDISMLYRNLYSVATTKDRSALDALRAIKQENLSSLEEALRGAALALGQSILSPLQSPQASNESQATEKSSLVDRGNDLLTQTNKLLSQLSS